MRGGNAKGQRLFPLFGHPKEAVRASCGRTIARMPSGTPYLSDIKGGSPRSLVACWLD